MRRKFWFLILILLIMPIKVRGEGGSLIYRATGGCLQSPFDRMVEPFPDQVTGWVFKGESSLAAAYAHKSGSAYWGLWGGFSDTASEIKEQKMIFVPEADGIISVDNSNNRTIADDSGFAGLVIQYGTGKIKPTLFLRGSFRRYKFNPNLVVEIPWRYSFPSPPSSTTSYISASSSFSVRNDEYSNGESDETHLALEAGLMGKYWWSGIEIGFLRSKEEITQGQRIMYDSSDYLSETGNYKYYTSLSYGLKFIWNDRSTLFFLDAVYYPGFSVKNNYLWKKFYLYAGNPADLNSAYTLYNLNYEENFYGNDGKGFELKVSLRREFFIGTFLEFTIGGSIRYGEQWGNYTSLGSFTPDSKVAHSEGKGNVNIENNFYTKFKGKVVRNFTKREKYMLIYLPILMNINYKPLRIKGGYVFENLWHYNLFKRETESLTPLSLITVNGAGGTTYSTLDEFLPQENIDRVSDNRSSNGYLLFEVEYRRDFGMISVDFIYPMNLFSVIVGVEL